MTRRPALAASGSSRCFYLSKIAGFFAIPSNVAIAVGLFGLLLMPTRFARLGRRLAIVSLIAVAVLGLSPLGNALILPLEQRFPAWRAAGATPVGIVVLGGAVTVGTFLAARGEVTLNEAAERMTVVADLARRYPAARIVFTGGSSALIFSSGTEAEFAVRLFETFGIARDRIIAEDQSRNTIENALFSKRLADPKPGSSGCW